MRIRWRGFELPTHVAIDQKTKSETYAKFVAEPFERGFGVSIGNTLRRVLLSSIAGAAVTKMRIEGVQHQYSTIPGVVEDVTEIVLNTKQLLPKMENDGIEILELNVTLEEGQAPIEVTAASIDCPTGSEIVNKDLVLFTITEPTTVNMELTIQRGRGYQPGTEVIKDDSDIGLIPVDAVFSPVRKVRFRTEDTRVGQLTNYDRLILEIWTDGTVDPADAVVEASKILRKHLNPFVYYEELGSDLVDTPREGVEASTGSNGDLDDALGATIGTLDLSVRARNCIESEQITVIRDLVSRTENDLLKIRNFGKTSLREIKKKLEDRNLSLGMDVATAKAVVRPEDM